MGYGPKPSPGAIRKALLYKKKSCRLNLGGILTPAIGGHGWMLEGVILSLALFVMRGAQVFI